MKFFVETLLEKNLVTAQQLCAALLVQASRQPSMLELVHQAKILSPEQIVTVCFEQARTDSSFREAASRLGIWNDAFQASISALAEVSVPSLVEILREQNVLSSEVITGVLETLSAAGPSAPTMSAPVVAASLTPAERLENLPVSTAPAEVAIPQSSDHASGHTSVTGDAATFGMTTTAMLAGASADTTVDTTRDGYDISPDLTALVPGSSFREFLGDDLRKELQNTQSLLKASSGSAENWQALGKEMFHCFHQIKGASRFLGESILERLSDEAEKLLEFVTTAGAQSTPTSRETVVSTLDLLQVTVWKIRDCRAQDLALPADLVSLAERACQFAAEVSMKMKTGESTPVQQAA